MTRHIFHFKKEIGYGTFFAQKEKEKKENNKNRKVTKMKKEMNLKKQTLLRGLLGIPLGIAIGYLITIVLSLIWGNGYYSPCVPSLASIMGSEIGAVVLQTTLCALLGASFGATSAIWQIEHWGIVKQTGIYFLINAIVMMPVAYFSYWMEHTLAGFLQYFGIFVLIFAIVWVAQFARGRRDVDAMNARLHGTRQDKDK